jgi:beta-galactosidase
MRVDRRSFLAAGGLGVAASLAPALANAAEADPLAIADEGWSLWIDQAAPGRTTTSTCRAGST